MSATAATLTKVLAWRPGGYLRASGVLFGWLALRTAAQTALFVLVASGQQSRQNSDTRQSGHPRRA